jgi:hypothetical protein
MHPIPQTADIKRRIQPAESPPQNLLRWRPEHFSNILALCTLSLALSVLDRRGERAERQTLHIAELRKRAAEADAKLKRLYDAIENGVADVADPMLKDPIAQLKAIRDQARADAASEIVTAIGERFNCCPRPRIVLGIGALHAEREWPHEYGVAFLAELRSHCSGTFFLYWGR